MVYSWGDNSVSCTAGTVKTGQLDIPSTFLVAQVACGANFSAQLLLLVSELSVVIKAYTGSLLGVVA